MLKLIINGAMGRMGQMIMEAAAGKFQLAAAIEAPNHPDVGTIQNTPLGPTTILSASDSSSWKSLNGNLAIDFSAPEASVSFIETMADLNIPVVSGTTGLSEQDHERIKIASQKIPVLWAANTSIGVLAMHELATKAKEILGPTYDVEIVEIHHRHKKDAPSGTALSLASTLGNDLQVVTNRGAGARKDNELGVLAVRGGEVVGDHTIYFLGPHDRIEITHRASSRMAFAQGALTLGEKLVLKKPGLYSVRDLF